MASLAPSKRVFEGLNQVVHERLMLSIGKITHTVSTVFEGSVYDRSDQRSIFAEFEENSEESCPETSDTFDILYDENHKSVVVYPAQPDASEQNNSGEMLHDGQEEDAREEEEGQICQ